MKKIFLQILCALLLTLPLTAQRSVQKPEIFDQFAKINLDDLMGRLDNFIFQSRKSSGTKAHIRIFGSNEDCFLCRYRFGAVIDAYLKNTRKISSGGYFIEYCDDDGEDLRTELYLLPSPSKLPQCAETAEAPQKSVLFDTVGFYYKDSELLPLENSFVEIGPTNGEYSAEVLKKVQNILEKSSESKIFIVVYLGTNPKSNFADRNGESTKRTIRKPDQKSLARKLLRNAEKELIKNGVRRAQIQTIDGGYVEGKRKLQFWFVPKGGETPKLEPANRVEN